MALQAMGQAKGVPATLKDSLAVYNNAVAVQAFYEKSGLYVRRNEYRLATSDPDKIHAGNDRRYAEVLKTINDYRITPTGRRKIRADEYRIVVDKYRYKQRELSDYVLNTDAPMQLFDRRIAPQVLMDYTMTGAPTSPINDDDVDFKMYDPVAIKPWSMLTAAERADREKRYPRPAKPEALGTSMPKAEKVAKPMPVASAKAAVITEYVISGALPDSARFKRFKTRKEAEAFIKMLREDVETR
jgi:hypothetical protein